MTARLLSRQLQRAGYRIVLAASCSDALAAVGSFEIAILDIELGDGDGIELGARLLCERRVRQVIFHSAIDEPARRARAEQLGAIVPKSAAPQDLLAAIETALMAAKLGP